MQTESGRLKRAVAELITTRGVPAHIRSDNEPEFTAKVICEWPGGVGLGLSSSSLDRRGRADMWRALTAS